MHRASVDDFARGGGDPSRVVLQDHATFRAVAGRIRLYTRTHWAEVFGRRCGFYICCFVTVMRMTVLRPRWVSSLVCGSGKEGLFPSRLGDEGFPAMLAAKVIGLSVALRSQRRCLGYRHSANRVYGHCSDPILDILCTLLWPVRI
jgi:hypothetical protein